MSYKAGIIAAITELKDRTGSSMQAIKKHMQSEMGDKKWLNGQFLKALKDGVEKGDFIKVKSSYKLSPAAKAAAKPKKAPKKKPAPKKKAAPKKKTAPKKKAAPKKKTAPKKKAATKKKAAPKKKTTSTKKTKKKTSLVRLGSPETPYDWDVDMGEDIPAGLQTGMIEGAENPNHAATKITCGVLGIATTAALGLYLYKRRHRTETKNTETEHSDSTPDPMEDVV